MDNRNDLKRSRVEQIVLDERNLWQLFSSTLRLERVVVFHAHAPAYTSQNLYEKQNCRVTNEIPCEYSHRFYEFVCELPRTGAAKKDP